MLRRVALPLLSQGLPCCRKPPLKIDTSCGLGPAPNAVRFGIRDLANIL